jgi:hypothetical protein
MDQPAFFKINFSRAGYLTIKKIVDPAPASGMSFIDDKAD